MAQVSSRVVINQRVIDELSEAAALALELTAEAIHTEVIQAQVMPRATGVMLGESTSVNRLKAGTEIRTRYEKKKEDEEEIEVVNAISKARNGVVSISTSAPQVRRLYFHPEYNFHKAPWSKVVRHRDGTEETIKGDGNPNAKAYWFEDWQEGGKHEDFARDAFAKFYRRLTDV